MKDLLIGTRTVGPGHPPLVIPEIGINHGGDLDKAVQMVDAAHEAGAECVKFQCHIIEDEMLPNNVIPANADVSIWDIISGCRLSETEDIKLKRYVESRGMIYLSTPFSRAAADRLERMGVPAYKIGSGECNNYPLLNHIAAFGKPVILSTGMNNLESIGKAVAILRRHKVPHALLHCVSMYPTPYDKVRLGSLSDLARRFPETVLGLSDHSYGNYTAFAAIALGARIVEKHFTASKKWPGPDIDISIDPGELRDLIVGSRAIHQALGGKKEILPEEQPTIDFAYASVVTIKDVVKGEFFSPGNLWVKRPGTGPIPAERYDDILGRKAARDVAAGTQLSETMIEPK
jgi:N-acetylneuraminate synthase